ncbi:SRPBCC family protein [Paenibacillus sp. 1P07SE]|uniref:SRPBCC family protein n=1 Tax=Paenibacillus sp. 1P07SE TaxID=3132209 RepID=UPI0039A5F2E7
MLALLSQTPEGTTARFERHLGHPVDRVWAYLTENDKLKRWFSELEVETLEEGGLIKFDMQDGTFEELRILEMKWQEVLEYTWGEDQVRFELYPEPAGCKLVLIEKIRQLTDHSPKDLAGWHVCLDVIEALLGGRTIDDREEHWSHLHPQYADRIAQLAQG